MATLKQLAKYLNSSKIKVTDDNQTKKSLLFF